MSNSEQIDTWTEVCHVTVNAIGETFNAHLGALSQQIEVRTGQRNVDFLPITNPGRVKKKLPEGDTIVRIQAFPISAGFSESVPPTNNFDGFLNFLYGTPSIETDGRIRIDSALTRRKVRLVLRWSTETFNPDQPSPTFVYAEDEMLATDHNYRIILADGYLVSATHQFIQGVLRVTMEFKFPAMDLEGNYCYRFQSTDSTGATNFSALSNYTTANKF